MSNESKGGEKAEVDFDYTVTTEKNFDAAVAAVEEKSKEKGFRVLHVHDMRALLEEKGFHLEPLKIIEICQSKLAHKFLSEDIQTSLCMPCRINIYTRNGRTHISAMRPVILPQFFPKASFGSLTGELDEIVRGIVDEAK